MSRAMRQVVMPTAMALVLGVLRLAAADQTYEQRFAQEYARIGIGFVSAPGLVDTNNPGPNLKAKPLPFSRFRAAGELAGIRLGMTMSEVVAAWGKPNAIFTRCGIGPLFTYGRYASLSFRANRLVQLGLSEKLFAGMVFDNGLQAEMRRPQVEALLGPPAPPRPEERHPWTDDNTYLTNGIRLAVWYHSVSRTPTSAFLVDAADGIAVRLDDEFGVATDRQQPPANPSPPSQ